MATIVHARMRPEGLRFRLWSTVSDAYCCEPMEREAFARWMRERAVKDAVAEVAARLDRAATSGTSAQWYESTMSAEWDAERCHECGSYHHKYDPVSEGNCRVCGDGWRTQSHRKPCR